MSDTHENIYVERPGNPNHRHLIFLGVLVGLGILALVLVRAFTHKGKGDGSPGNWTGDELKKFKQTVHNGSGLPSSALDCIAKQVAKHYSFNDAMAKKVSDGNQKKYIDICFGAAVHWNNDIRDFFIQQMQNKGFQTYLSQQCASCIIDGISNKYSPVQFLTCIEDSNAPGCSKFENDMDNISNNCHIQKMC